MDLVEGAVIANRFRLVRQLGKGGMGSVWLAQHIGLDIPCAVKFIHAESAANPEARARFEREAKAAAQLRTPNVVQILDYGVEDETPYIAMELLVGEPLSVRLHRRVRLEPFETYQVAEQVGRALTKAHAAGIVHRDLKPENIFLVADEDGEIAKVLDFGVAKKTLGLTDSNTKTGALLGTPYYMSPEQAQGTKAVDSRADLWSLAVLVYRAITGELPFRSEALGDLLIKIVMHPLPVPSHVAHGVPPGFDDWWLRAAQRDPDHRFQTAKAFVEGLRQVLTGQGAGRSADGSVPYAHSAAGGTGAMPAGAGPSPNPAGGWGAAPQPAHGQTQMSGSTPWPGGSSLPFAAPGLTGAAVAQAGSGLGAPAGAGALAVSGAGQGMPYAQGSTVLAPAGSVPIGFTGGDSGSGPSVAGFATQATRPRNAGRRAFIGALIAAGLVVGAVTTVLAYRSMSGATADESSAASSEPSSSGEETSVASAPERTSGDDAGAEAPAAAPSDSAASADGTTVAPSGTAQAEPPPTKAPAAKPPPGQPSGTQPPAIPTTLDVPKPPPTAKPKTGDLGF